MSGSKGSAEPLLSVKGLVAGYGSVEVLHEVSLEVREGEIVTLIGGNGAGKSTTLMCISGIVPVRGGEIRFAGEKISDGSGGVRADKLVGRGLVQVPEGRRIFPRMTVLENLMMGAYGRDDKDGIAHDLEHVYALFDILKQRSPQLGGTLSGGEQQMLAISRALMLRPRMLLLDEPSFGLAPLIVAEIFRIMRKINEEEKVSMLLVEQNANIALDVSHHAYLLETGRIAVSGPSQQIKNDETIRRVYLGY